MTLPDTAREAANDVPAVVTRGAVLYLIFSHHRQHQLARLVHSITALSPDCLIAIHHDPTQEELNPANFSCMPHVHIVPQPVRGEWGDFSLVDQYLHSMNWCLDNLEWAWLCSLTGLTYPIHALADFELKLAASGYDAFIRYFDALDTGPGPKGAIPFGEAQNRYLYWYVKLPRFHYWHRVPANIRRMLRRSREKLNEMQRFIRVQPMPRGCRTRLGFRRHRTPLPHGYFLCGGRQMLNVNRKACCRVFEFIQTHPEYVRYFKRTLIPDEAFFTTILANDPNLNVCNNVLRYIKWPKSVGAASVAVITQTDVDAILLTGEAFGLKFDEEVDSSALDRVDFAIGLSVANRPACESILGSSNGTVSKPPIN